MKMKYFLPLLALGMLASGCRDGNRIPEETAEAMGTSLTLWAADVDTVLVVTISGSEDYKVHDITYSLLLEEYGYVLHQVPQIDPSGGTPVQEPENWRTVRGGAYAYASDQEDLRDKINELIVFNEGSTTMSLLVVGKSLGAILAWATFRNFPRTAFSDRFERTALVMVDPHGAAEGDANYESYNEEDDLYWPASFPTDQSEFRLYHVFQQKTGKITGASFPDSRVCKSRDLTDDDEVSHSNIIEREETAALIREAFEFVYRGTWWQEKPENQCD